MKAKLLLCTLIFAATATMGFSQADISSLGFNYSALVRDTAGKVQPSKAVTLRFTLLQGQNGSVTNAPYMETQKTTTDAYGFVNVSIGNGTPSGTGSFASLDFTAVNYWILIEVYNTFTGTYDALAKEALNAVPYAKVAGALTGAAAIPAGTIVAFGGDTAHVPVGWVLCDGRALSITNPKYLALFNAIGFNWGQPDGTHFKVPYTLGMFLRGGNNGSGNDPDVASRTSIPGTTSNSGDKVGSFQADVFQNHTHDLYSSLTGGQSAAVTVMTYRNPGGGYNLSHTGQYVEYTNLQVMGVNGANVGGGTPRLSVETRPKNVNVNYIIKL